MIHKYVKRAPSSAKRAVYCTDLAQLTLVRIFDMHVCQKSPRFCQQSRRYTYSKKKMSKEPCIAQISHCYELAVSGCNGPPHQSVAVCCRVWRCVAAWCSVLQGIMVSRTTVSQCVAVYCSVL